MSTFSHQSGFRRWASAALLFGCFAFFGVGSALAQGRIEQATLELISPRDPQVGAQVAIADALGYFKDEGLTVTVRWVPTTGDVITLMAGGTQHLGTGISFSQVVFGGQKLPIKTIAPLADVAGAIGMVLSPGVKISHPRELEGKKLAFTQGTSQILILAKMAKVYDFDIKKVQLINMNPPEGVVAASRGDVDGILSFQPFLYRLVQMGGTQYITGAMSFIGPKPVKFAATDKFQYNYAVLHASQTWINEKPNTLKAVLRALRKATDLLVKDRAKAIAILEKGLRLDNAAITAMVEANDYGMTINEEVATSMRYQSDWMLSIKRIPSPVTPQEVIHAQLLREVDPKLVTWDGK
jgi:NitT/TauT family transport system substrate-binding protein